MIRYAILGFGLALALAAPAMANKTCYAGSGQSAGDSCSCYGTNSATIPTCTGTVKSDKTLGLICDCGAKIVGNPGGGASLKTGSKTKDPKAAKGSAGEAGRRGAGKETKKASSAKDGE